MYFDDIEREKAREGESERFRRSRIEDGG